MEWVIRYMYVCSVLHGLGNIPSLRVIIWTLSFNEQITRCVADKVTWKDRIILMFWMSALLNRIRRRNRLKSFKFKTKRFFFFYVMTLFQFLSRCRPKYRTAFFEELVCCLNIPVDAFFSAKSKVTMSFRYIYFYFPISKSGCSLINLLFKI